MKHPENKNVVLLLNRSWEDPSPSTKKRKRQRQKVRRRLKFASGSSAGGTDNSSEPEQYKEYVVGRILPDEIGDVLHMKLEDFYQEWDENAVYTPTYLLECRKQLIRKVESYRCKIEELHSEKAQTALKHRKEIEEIRTFYQNIAYGTSRSGRIVKKAMSTSDAAKELLDMLGYEKLRKQLSMESDSDYM